MTTGVLDEYGTETLQRTEGCAVNHHRGLLLVVLIGILQLEALRQVVVYLDSSQLPAATDSVLDHEVELRTIECCLTIFYLGGQPLLTTCLHNSSLSQCPVLVSTYVLVVVVRITQGNLCLEVETEGCQYDTDDIHHVEELLLHLVGTTEQVGIVLCEGTYTGQSVQLTTLLITVYRTELGDTQRQVTVATGLPCENLTVVRTVHGFQHVLLILLWGMDGLEGVLTIMGIVTTGNIEVLGTDMRSNNLLITKTFLHFTQVVLQAETQVGTFRQPDGETLTHFIGEHEQLHLLTDLTVVAFLSLLQHDEILVEHLFLGERDTIQTLHLLTGSVTTPESTSHIGQLDSLDGTGVHQVRTTAEVGERTLCIGGDTAVLQVLLDVLALIGLTVSGKLFQSVCLCHLLANDGLFLGSQFTHFLLNLREVTLLDALTVFQQHIIEETILDGRTESELDTGIKLLQCLSKQMG